MLSFASATNTIGLRMSLRSEAELTPKWTIAEIITDQQPTPFWRMLTQLGVKHVVGVLPRNFSDWRQSKAEEPWDYYPLSRYKKAMEEEGLELVAIEDNPPMDSLRCGMPGAEEELENVYKMIENMGKLGIRIWCYNWMPYLGWIRTSTRLRGRGGAIVSGYDKEFMDRCPPYPNGPFTSELLWRTLKKFLENVIPVAEQSGVKLAMHPDDPPSASPIRGISRIMNTIDSYDRLLELDSSEANGITLCQGNFTLMTNDLPSVIRHFGRKRRIYFVHFRDVRGDADKFVETFIDEGKTDMVECMKAYRDVEFEGIMRSDHTPALHGDEESIPGYSSLARLHAIGYMTGVGHAISNRQHSK